MKRVLIVILALLLALPLAAGVYNDVSFSLGLDQYDLDGISASYGVNVGLTSRLELDLWGISELIDMPFSENVFGAELCYSLIGKRSTGTIVAGSGINTIVGTGMFYNTENNGYGPIVSITPICVGSPITGKRERIFRTGLGWDIENKELFVSFSLVNIDIYARGTYRDYEY